MSDFIIESTKYRGWDSSSKLPMADNTEKEADVWRKKGRARVISRPRSFVTVVCIYMFTRHAVPS